MACNYIVAWNTEKKSCLFYRSLENELEQATQTMAKASNDAVTITCI